MDLQKIMGYLVQYKKSGHMTEGEAGYLYAQLRGAEEQGMIKDCLHWMMKHRDPTIRCFCIQVLNKNGIHYE